MLGQAEQYLRGLVQAGRKNMERMAEAVPETDYQQLQHFLTHSPWDHRLVMQQVAAEADRLLGGQPDTCLLIDESGFIKKGKDSAGVARQWCGRLGKVENCQVGVFAVLCHGERHIPIDGRLYLPKEWSDDRQRCRKAGIPDADIVARSKAEHALAMVKQARASGMRFAWVGLDGGYGKSLPPGLTRGSRGCCVRWTPTARPSLPISIRARSSISRTRSRTSRSVPAGVAVTQPVCRRRLPAFGSICGWQSNPPRPGGVSAYATALAAR